MASFVAVYDACVLYPAPLRDLLLRLALTDLFRARWSERIHEEWMRSVLAVCAAVRGQREALRNSPRSVRELLDTFFLGARRQRCATGEHATTDMNAIGNLIQSVARVSIPEMLATAGAVPVWQIARRLLQPKASIRKSTHGKSGGHWRSG